MKKYLLLLISTTLIAGCDISVAQGLQNSPVPPELTTYVERFHRNHKPVNEFCLKPEICGAPNSTLPNKRIVDSDFEQFDDGSVNKVRTTVNISAPAYHATSIITERFLTNALTGVAAGYLTVVSSNDGGVINSTSMFSLGSLEIGIMMSYGRLSRNVTNASGSAVNKIELFESSSTSLGVTGGSEGYVFNYLIPFQVVEKTWDEQGELVNVGIVSPAEIHFITDGGSRNVIDLGNGVSAIMVKIVGGGGFRKFDITPACFRPYYHYGFSTPSLLSTEKVKPRTTDD